MGKLYDDAQKQDAKRSAQTVERPKNAKPPARARGAVLAAVRGEVQKLEADGPIVRLIFPAPKGLADQITSYWHRHKLDSKSAAIRKLIELGLEK